MEREPRRQGSQPSKIDMDLLLRILAAITTAGGSYAETAELVGTSRATLYRLLAAAEQTLGVRVGSVENRLQVDDWGVLRPDRVWEAPVLRALSPPEA